jgi:predicted small integral membrane protein
MTWCAVFPAWETLSPSTGPRLPGVASTRRVLPRRELLLLLGVAFFHLLSLLLVPLFHRLPLRVAGVLAV